MRHVITAMSASLLLLVSACAMEGDELSLDEAQLSLQEEAVTLEADRAEAASPEENGDVEVAWDQCRISVGWVQAFMSSEGTAYWGWYGPGLIFANLGNGRYRFRNWWGPGDPFPGQGAAWINFSQTLPIECPW